MEPRIHHRERLDPLTVRSAAAHLTTIEYVPVIVEEPSQPHQAEKATEAACPECKSTENCARQPVPLELPIVPARAPNNAPERRRFRRDAERRTRPTRALESGKHARRWAAWATPRTGDSHPSRSALWRRQLGRSLGSWPQVAVTISSA